MNSIFRKRNRDVQTLFSSAGKPTKVMCVAFDYAKRSHTCVILDGEGRRLRGRFDINNDKSGLGYLLEIVGGLCRKHGIDHRHVMFGGEDCGTFARNFINALVARGFLVVGFNAKAVAKERETTCASTDLIDTIGVAGMMIKMRGRTIGEAEENVHGIKRLRHQRAALLRAHSSSSHRIHSIVDELLPGFLDASRSGLEPFSRASKWLMRERFSAGQIHARKSPHLAKHFRKLAVTDPDHSVEMIKRLAEQALPPAQGIVPALQRSLKDELSLYEHLDHSLRELDTDIARQLARTPGAMLTTIPGIGQKWAAGLYSELADPARRRNVHSMAALGGIVPRVKQSGGPNSPAVAGHRNRGASAVLKNILIGAAVSVSQYGHEEVRAGFEYDRQMGRDARGRLAQKILRVSLCIIDSGLFYLPPSLHASGNPRAVRDYYQYMWPKVLIKWRNGGLVSDALAHGNPLREWRDMACKLYDLNLAD